LLLRPLRSLASCPFIIALLTRARTSGAPPKRAVNFGLSRSPNGPTTTAPPSSPLWEPRRLDDRNAAYTLAAYLA
jgi:hypothetical protein